MDGCHGRTPNATQRVNFKKNKYVFLLLEGHLLAAHDCRKEFKITYILQGLHGQNTEFVMDGHHFVILNVRP